MVLVEMGIGLIPDLLTPTIQAIMVDNLVFIVMLIREVSIGLTPAKFIHKAMVDRKLLTQGFLKKTFTIS